MPEISLKKAVLINAVSRYSVIVLNLVFTAVLSRILTPEDYGIAAIITVFTAFFGILSDLGMGTAVIQDKTLTGTGINHIFTFSVYIAAGLGAVFCLLGFPLAWLYQNRVYIPAACMLSLSLFFNTLNMIPNALLLKEKRFLLTGIRLIIVTVITYGGTIVLALRDFKYYALIIQSVLSAALTFFWNMKSVKLRPVIKINFEYIRKIRQYSGYQFGFNIVNYFCRNLDKLIIGKVMGGVPLAQYDKAYRMMMYPYQNLTHVITPALHPVLSDYQHDKEYIYQKYIRIVKFLSLPGIWVTAVCFWCGEEMIILVFGNQWHDAADAFKWLSLSIWVQIMNGLSGTIFQSLGDTRRMFQGCVINTALSVVALSAGVFLGTLKMVSVCISINFVANFLVTSCLLLTIVFRKSIFSFFRMFVPDFFILSILFVLPRIVMPNTGMEHYFFFFCLKLGVISAAWFVLLVITKQMVYLKRGVLP